MGRVCVSLPSGTNQRKRNQKCLRVCKINRWALFPIFLQFLLTMVGPQAEVSGGCPSVLSREATRKYYRLLAECVSKGLLAPVCWHRQLRHVCRGLCFEFPTSPVEIRSHFPSELTQKVDPSLPMLLQILLSIFKKNYLYCSLKKMRH